MRSPLTRRRTEGEEDGAEVERGKERWANKKSGSDIVRFPKLLLTAAAAAAAADEKYYSTGRLSWTGNKERETDKERTEERDAKRR